MLDISFYLSGLAVVLSIFILAVSVRAYSRTHVRIFGFLIAVFVILLADSLIYTITGFIFFQLPFTMNEMFLFSDVAILLIFYFGAVRGS